MTDTPTDSSTPRTGETARRRKRVKSRIHANMFLALLSVPSILDQILRAYLRPEMVGIMVDKPPRILPSVFIDGWLDRSGCDVLCEVQLDSELTPYAYVILEHRSKPKTETVGVLTMCECRVREVDAVRLYLSASTLVPVFHIVVYTGKRPWDAPLNFQELINLGNDPALAQPAWGESYDVIDIHRTPIRDLCRYPNGRAALALLKRPKFEKLVPELVGIPDVGVLHQQAGTYIDRCYERVSKEQWSRVRSALDAASEGWDTE